MANNFDADFRDVLAKEQQDVFYKMNVAAKIADLSAQSQMSDGVTFTKPLRWALSAQIITRWSDMTLDDLTDVAEFLTVNRQFGTAFQYHDFDSIQSAYDLGAAYGRDAGELLSNLVDAYVLAEALNAGSTVTGGTLSTANVISSISAVKQALRKKNVSSTNLYGVISPEFESIMTQYVEAKETALGDKVGENGYIGMYMGVKLHVSNQLTSTASLALATNVTAADTVTIAGQVFTFRAVPAIAWEVTIGATVDLTRANFTALINAPATTTAGGIALTGNALRTFQNTISAVNDNTANTMVVTARGIGVLDVSETLTDATDTWTATAQLQHNLFGVYGNPTLVIQRKPTLEVVQKQLQLGKNILNGVLFGVKTFTENATRMVNFTIRCDAYNA